MHYIFITAYQIFSNFTVINNIIQLCKHVVAKVTLVPCSVKLTGKRDKVGQGEVTINNARIIVYLEKQCDKNYRYRCYADFIIKL